MSSLELEGSTPNACEHCGGSDLVSDTVRSAFFEGERLVVVEGIPALVCRGCGAQYFDDRTVMVLDLLRGDGFPADRAAAELNVPVFRFGDRLAHGTG
jgi:YgiT-type zinc finger domain-containing protein